MAVAKKKKSSMLEDDLSSADMMTILSGGGTSNVFRKNTLIDYSYQTGISIIDYAYGYEVNIYDDMNQFIGKRNVLGLQAGSFNVVTGRTQSYKTTISVQILANMAYANGGNIIHYDAENRLVEQRAKSLSKLPETWFTGEFPRYSVRTGAISFDSLLNDITEIYERKMRNRDILTKDTGVVDSHNKPIKLMPPTLILLDSLQDVITKEYDIDKKDFNDTSELKKGTQGARNAYTIRGFITDILPMLKEANITMICIAHKTANMSLTAVSGVKKQFQYGNNDERISGGSAVEFNASSVMNYSGLTDKAYHYHMDTDGFEGNAILFEPTKSSTNESGNEKSGLGFKIVVDKRREGVDNLRTLVLFMNDRGRLKGNKAGYRVLDKNGEPMSEGRFSWRNIYEDFKQDLPTYKAFMVACKEELETLIAKAPEDISGTIEPFNIDKIVSALDDDKPGMISITADDLATAA